VETVVNLCCYQLVTPSLVNLIEGDFHIAWLARDHVSCALYGMFFSSTLVPFLLTSVVRFSRLPVRTLLFLCAVCNHGGHQSCYREYYMGQPMVDLPSSSPQLTDSRDHHPSTTRNQQTNEDDYTSMNSSQSNLIDSSVSESSVQTHQNRKSPKLAGHPCAAGCGHLCWAANKDSEDL